MWDTLVSEKKNFEKQGTLVRGNKPKIRYLKKDLTRVGSDVVVYSWSDELMKFQRNHEFPIIK